MAPGARAAIPYPAIEGYAPGKREAIEWWWEAVPGLAAASAPGAVHAVVVGL